MGSRNAIGEQEVKREEATLPPCNKQQAAARLVLLHHVVRARVRADLPQQSTARQPGGGWCCSCFTHASGWAP